MKFFLVSLLFISSFSFAALHPRDLDGIPSNGHEGVYDDVLDITWLRNSSVNGANWDLAKDIVALNYVASFNPYGFVGWRLPAISGPVNGVGFDYTYTFDGSTDLGYQISAPVHPTYNPNGQSPNFTGNELSYHYYNNLGCIGLRSGISTTYYQQFTSEAGFTNCSTTNASLFLNLSSAGYWQNSDYSIGSAFAFNGENGSQWYYPKQNAFQVWPVHDGDIGTSYSASTNDDLILYFPFDDQTATDFSFNGHNGNPVNNPDFTQAGFDGSGYSLTLDGANDYVNLGQLDNGQNFTISYWAKTDNPSTSYYHALYRGTPGSSSYDLAVGEAFGDMHVRLGSGGSQSYSTPNCQTNCAEHDQTGILENQWAHYAYVIDNDNQTIKLFLNGAKINNESFALGDVPTNHSSWYLGRSFTNNYWKGSIDEVKIYNSALSDEEIRKKSHENGLYASDIEDEPDKRVNIKIDSIDFDSQTDISTFNPAYPTAIVTHGWTHTGDYDTNNLGPVVTIPRRDIVNAVVATLSEDNFGVFNGVNILHLHWEGSYNIANGLSEGAFPASASASRNNAKEAAKDLAAVIKAIGVDASYTLPVHMIGHSHGALVNRHIADELTKIGSSIEQITILDAPTKFSAVGNFGRIDINEFVQLAENSNVALIDNYFSSNSVHGFGQGISGTYPLNNGQVLHDLGPGAHSEVASQFYTSYVEGQNSPEDIPGLFQSTGWPTYTIDTSHAQVLEWITPLKGITNSTYTSAVNDLVGSSSGSEMLSQTKVDFSGDVQNNDAGSIFVYGEANFTSMDVSIQTVFDFPNKIIVGDPISSVELTESSPASFNLPLNIPIEAISLRFDTVVANAGDGDWGSIYINGQLEWVMDLSEADTSSGQTHYIDVRGYAGSLPLLQVSLNSQGVANAKFYIANFTFITAADDLDSDGIADFYESSSCTDIMDADTDDDGLLDGDEDLNDNGVLDFGETDPCNLDTDSDGIQDGTESGISMPIPDDPANSFLGTDTNIFIPDADVLTTTDPTLSDTDGDTLSDGIEDPNFNGAFDEGESDPADNSSITPGLTVPMLPSMAFLLLAIIFGVVYRQRLLPVGKAEH